jgi:hypothetical protein
VLESRTVNSATPWSAMIERLPELVNGDATLPRRGRHLTVDIMIEIAGEPYYVSIERGRVSALQRGTVVWHDTYYGAPTDGSAWPEGGDISRRVLRSGSWNGNPKYLRVAHRGRSKTGFRNSNIGFRVARTLTPWRMPKVAATSGLRSQRYFGWLGDCHQCRIDLLRWGIMHRHVECYEHCNQRECSNHIKVGIFPNAPPRVRLRFRHANRMSLEN